MFDGDLVMWESNSVCRYLCNKHGPSAIYPTELDRRVLVERWMDWQLSVMTPALTPLYFLLYRLPAAQRTPDEIARRAKDTEAPIKILGSAIGRPALSRRRRADAGRYRQRHLGPSLVRDGQGNRDSKVSAWLARLGDNAAFREHVIEVALE